ncbi:MAG: Unknown protein [uncultured Sulfurovum sp.]|uniref:Methyltransferase domain-containing protein n=1 Tax=uncultured Sulfurovum sp. TaxID=269237 RepID=A0A6S6TSQ5_9BACT|nr:MAG: Unknown protein [uncultured Sulfurovum sp.]
MNEEQINQDEEYDFPYHYIPSFRADFIHSLSWGWSKNYTSAIEFVLKEVEKELENTSTLFDIGCGDGRLTRELNIEFSELKIMGVDYSSKAIALAKAMNPNMQFLNADITTKEFDLKCDALTLIEVFEHIPLDFCNDFVEALSQMLNRNGVIFLTVPSTNMEVSYKHSQHFTLALLEEYFGKYFHVEDMKYIQRGSFFLKLIYKFTHNSFYILNHKGLNNFLYNLYKKRYFDANENNAERIYVKLRKKEK